MNNTSGKFQTLEEVHSCITAILDELGKWRTNCRVSLNCKECVLEEISTSGLCGMLSDKALKDRLIKVKLRIEEKWEAEKG